MAAWPVFITIFMCVFTLGSAREEADTYFSTYRCRGGKEARKGNSMQ